MEKPVKILVVDDSPETHTMAELLFGPTGKASAKSVLLHAENGQQGLKLLAAHLDLDAVILDLSMPVMDGFTFLEHWKTDCRFQSIPICVFTGNKKEAAKALSLGARDFLVKAGDQQELRLRVLNLIENKRRAQASEQAKVDFLSVVSHELRTPMNGIVGMAQAIRLGGLTPEQTQYLDILELSSRRMMTMINNVLGFLESENPLHRLPRVPFDVRDTVAGTLELHADEARRNRVLAQVLVSPEVPDRVIGLPDKLHLVLDHLVGNAIKFSPGGNVVVEVVPKHASEQQVTLHFSVRDNGPGFPVENRGQLFQPFTQVDGSQTRAFGGLGLGLSIADRLVQMLGGALEVQSELGNGSTFHFHCPFERA